MTGVTVVWASNLAKKAFLVGMDEDNLLARVGDLLK